MNLPEYFDPSRHAETKAYMRRLWQGELRGALAYNALIGSDTGQPVDCHSESAGIGAQFLRGCLETMGHRIWGRDHGVPMIQPLSRLSAGGGVMATAFGAAYDGEYDHTAPIIHRADRIESLNLSPTLEDGCIPQALEVIRYVVDETEGKVPLQMYNAGGPMDIASMVLYDTELLTALYTHPKQVHRLLQACTDLFIEFYRAQRELVPEWSPAIAEDMYIPADQGILCGEDWLATMSPETAMEFEVPYMNQISDAFGGLAIHSCGALMHQFDLLKDHIRNLRGFYFNAGTTSFEVAVDKFRGTDVVLMPRWDVNKPFRYASRLDFVRKLLAVKTDDITVYLIASFPEDPMVPRERDPAAGSVEIIEYIEGVKEERGW